MQPFIYGRTPFPRETSWILTPYQRQDSYLAAQETEPVTKGSICRAAGTGDRLLRNHYLFRRTDNAKRVTLRTHRAGA